jgi:hypothetical protein
MPAFSIYYNKSTNIEVKSAGKRVVKQMTAGKLHSRQPLCVLNRDSPGDISRPCTCLRSFQYFGMFFSKIIL